MRLLAQPQGMLLRLRRLKDPIVVGKMQTLTDRHHFRTISVNPSEAPSELLVWVLANIDDPTVLFNYPLPDTWLLHHDAPFAPGVEVPVGPATLRLRRIELPVEGRLPAPAEGLQYGVTLLTNPAGTPITGPSVGNLPDGRLVNIGRKPATVYVLNLEPIGEDAETTPAATPLS